MGKFEIKCEIEHFTFFFGNLFPTTVPGIHQIVSKAQCVFEVDDSESDFIF